MDVTWHSRTTKSSFFSTNQLKSFKILQRLLGHKKQVCVTKKKHFKPQTLLRTFKYFMLYSRLTCISLHTVLEIQHAISRRRETIDVKMSFHCIEWSRKLLRSKCRNDDWWDLFIKSVIILVWHSMLTFSVDDVGQQTHFIQNVICELLLRVEKSWRLAKGFEESN